MLPPHADGPHASGHTAKQLEPLLSALARPNGMRPLGHPRCGPGNLRQKPCARKLLDQKANKAAEMQGLLAHLQTEMETK